MITAYKLFKRRDGVLTSITDKPGIGIRYYEGVMNRAPHGTKLFVFKKPEHARNFGAAPNYLIWQVECGDSLQRLVRIIDVGEPPLLFKRYLFDFWSMVDEGGYINPPGSRATKQSWIRRTSYAPTGTYVCDWVRLIRQVER